MTRIKKAFPMLILAALIFAALIGMYFAFQLSPVEMSSETRRSAFSIARGAAFKDISVSLEESDLIRSALAFRMYSILRGAAHQLKPGMYEVNAASSSAEILDQLVEGPAYDAEVLIFEGETMYDIDKKLSERGIIERGALTKLKPEDFLEEYPFLEGIDTLEGFLFPDTYRFSFDAAPRRVAEVFLDNFVKQAWPLLSKGRRDYYQTLIVASMLEREVPEYEDRQIVAGIIYRRLEIPMRLQIDATSLYEKYGGAGYNTYTNDGLPPGPIGNPGVEAIEAATKPKTTAYLYYLSHPETKETLFSKTFDEHDTKRAQYLR